MNAREKVNALLEWLKGYEPLDGLMKFNTVSNMAGERSVTTSFDITPITQYIDGSTSNIMTFFLVTMEDFDTGYSDTNINAMDFIADWNEWVKSEWALGRGPEWSNILITNIRPGYNMPNLAGVDQDGKTAKYMMQVQIDYIEKQSDMFGREKG